MVAPCYPNFSATSANKLAPRSTRCIFIGYASHYKGYKCFNPLTGRIYISRHVVVHEHEFRYLEFIQNPSSTIFCSPIPLPECLVELSSPTLTIPYVAQFSPMSGPCSEAPVQALHFASNPSLTLAQPTSSLTPASPSSAQPLGPILPSPSPSYTALLCHFP